MSDEKKYLVFCWGAIIITLLFTLNQILGWLQGVEITVIASVLVLVLCMSACYIGNKPVENPTIN